MSEFFYDIVIETIMTIMEIIQERGVDITVKKKTNGQRHGSICPLQDIIKWNQSLHTVSSETTTKLVYRFA